jgi:hypothetical protein
MNSKQLKDVIARVEALKTSQASPEFQAGVDAATEVFNTTVQEALDRERMQALEQELSELRTRYPVEAPKRRGRRPKQTTPENTEFETVAGA